MEITTDLVRRLVAMQFPHWRDLPVSPVAESGWDNRTFRLGDALLARLPSAERYAAQVDKEWTWLPRLAPHLPLPISRPVAKGEPVEGYPWRWSVLEWLDGETVKRAGIADQTGFAADLARFLATLQAIDTTGGPPAGQHNFFRGGALATYDAETRRLIAELSSSFDVALAAAIWNRALASAWQRPPVWVHGDVAEGNLLVREGRLGAVIDFGGLAIGDPACDLVPAWTLFDERGRTAFRAALGLDAETWARGRGWALWKALLLFARHREGDPAQAEAARRCVLAVIDDHRRDG